MTTRRGIFALLAGAAATPLLNRSPFAAHRIIGGPFTSKPVPRPIDTGSYFRREYAIGYVVTREVLEDDLYAKVTEKLK